MDQSASGNRRRRWCTDDAVDHASPARAMYTPFSMASRRPRVGLNVGALATALVRAFVSAFLAPAGTCRMLWVMVLLSPGDAYSVSRPFGSSRAVCSTSAQTESRNLANDGLLQYLLQYLIAVWRSLFALHVQVFAATTGAHPDELVCSIARIFAAHPKAVRTMAFTSRKTGCENPSRSWFRSLARGFFSAQRGRVRKGWGSMGSSRLS